MTDAADQQTAGPDNLPPLRLIYIMGVGRSGSTMLDTLLGNHPDVVSVGELSNLPRAAWVENHYCSCGKRAGQCAFWSAVWADWHRRIPGEAAETVALRNRFESFRPATLFRLSRQRVWPSADLADYRHRCRALLESICRISGKRVVVDSSKNPLRALILSSLPEIDFRIVHLVRDGRAVAWSLQKSFRKDEQGGVFRPLHGRSVWSAMTLWTAINLLSNWVRRRRGTSSTLIRYEDVVSQPETILSPIAEATDLDLTSVIRAAQAGEAMHVGHTIAGNRLRMAGSVHLQPDWEWVQRLPVRDRRICWALAGWLLQRYEYPRQVAAAS